MGTTATAPTFQAGALPTAAQLNALAGMLNGIVSPWSSYAPVLTAATTSPTIGSGGTTVGRYQQVGKTVNVVGQLQFGSSGAAFGSGAYFLNLPVPASTVAGASIAGTLAINPNAGSAWGACIPFIYAPVIGTASSLFYFWGPGSSTSSMDTQITAASGVGGTAFAASGLFRWNLEYEAA